MLININSNGKLRIGQYYLEMKIIAMILYTCLEKKHLLRIIKN